MVTATAWSATPSSFDVLGLNPLGSRRGGGPHRPALPDLDLRSARRIGNVAGAQHHDTGHDDCHCGQGGQPPPAAHAAHRSSPRRWATAAASPRPATPGHAQLGQDPGDMDAGRLGGDEQLLADLAVGPPSGDQRQDLSLPRLR
jgi:hypothetical protein